MRYQKLLSWMNFKMIAQIHVWSSSPINLKNPDCPETGCFPSRTQDFYTFENRKKKLNLIERKIKIFFFQDFFCLFSNTSQFRHFDSKFVSTVLIFKTNTCYECKNSVWPVNNKTIWQFFLVAAIIECTFRKFFTIFYQERFRCL